MIKKSGMAEVLKTIDQFVLEKIIKEKIYRAGPISFCDFMENCLYYPGYGYYTSGRENIGQKGDYYTSPYVTPIFGKLLAKQIEEMWRVMGNREFSIVECGGDGGLLCIDILNELSKNEKLFDNLSYFIVEKKDELKNQERFIYYEKIKLVHNVSDLTEITGCIFSNELVDNFPVHEVVMQDELMEIFVGYKDHFVEIYRPASQELKDYFHDLNVQLLKGFRTEINLYAKSWIAEVSSILKNGFVMTIDYGGSSEELYNSRKSNGTLVCFTHHTHNDNPYMNIGNQDITAHVNFSALKKWGNDAGLQYTGYSDQAGFLRALGLANLIREEEKHHKISSLQISYFLHSFMIEMGSRIKILMQQKNLPQLNLSGLQFMRPLA